MVKTATNQNGDTKMATDCLDQNGDKLKRQKVKTAMGTARHSSYMNWTCVPVLGWRPQHTTRSCGQCECCQPSGHLLSSYGFNNGITAPTHRLVRIDVVATRQDLTAHNVEVVDIGLSNYSLLQWSASSVRSMPVVETFFRHPWHSWTMDINDFWSGLLSALHLLNGWQDPDPDMMASHDTELNTIFDRVIRYSHPPPTPEDSYIPALSTSVSSQCRSQADTQVISSRALYTFTQDTFSAPSFS